MSKLQTYISERKKLFRDKCTESFAKGGFLTTDLAGDWALDKEPIESFNEETIEGCLAIVREVADERFELFHLQNWSGEYEVYEEIERLKGDLLQALNTKE